MTWGRIDDDAPSHPKFIQAGPLAFGFFWAGVCYANRHQTDGFLPSKAIFSLLPGMRDRACLSCATALVEAGLWEVREGGYQIHDFLEYNPSAADVTEERRRTHARNVAGGRARSLTAVRIAGRFVQPNHQPENQPPAGERWYQPNQPAPAPSSDPTRSDPKKLEARKKQTTGAVPDAGYLATLRANPAYTGIDIDQELGKASAWAEPNRRRVTRRFFVNWLNRAAERRAEVNGHASSLGAKLDASLPAMQRFIERGKAP